MFSLRPFDGDGFLEDEARTQIFRADVFVGRKGFRGALLEDGSFIKQVSPVSDREGLANIVVGDDHTDILVFQFGDDELYVFDGDRVDSGERLVKQDELGVDGECPCNLAAASLASRELDSEALAYLREIELVDQAFQPFVPFLL